MPWSIASSRLLQNFQLCNSAHGASRCFPPLRWHCAFSPPRFWDVRERENRRNTSTVATPAPNLNLVWSSDGHYLVVRWAAGPGFETRALQGRPGGRRGGGIGWLYSSQMGQPRSNAWECT